MPTGTPSKCLACSGKHVKHTCYGGLRFKPTKKDATKAEDEKEEAKSANQAAEEKAVAAVAKAAAEAAAEAVAEIMRKEAEEDMEEETMTSTTSGVGWSQDEQERLMAAATKHPNDWKMMASLVGRTVDSCRSQYQTLLRQRKVMPIPASTDSGSSSGSSSSSGGSSKGVSVITTGWTREEMLVLVSAAKKHTNNWKQIAPIVGKRTPSSCRTK